MIKYGYFYLLIGSVFFIAGHYDTFIWMYERFLAEESYYSHGFLIPFIVMYLISIHREELFKLPVTGSKWGLLIIIFSVLMHIFGTVVYIFSISGFSIWLFIFGSVLFLFGWAVTRAVLFPLIFLLFMFPLPIAIISSISFPLKMIVANLGTNIVAMLGIPVYQEGFNISIPQGDLLVGNPCSGLRSLIAFLALGFLFAYLSDLSAVKKVVLFLLTIPIAIFSNLIRVPILIIWSYKWGLESAAPDTFVHTGSGILVFLIGMFFLFIAIYFMRGKYEK